MGRWGKEGGEWQGEGRGWGGGVGEAADPSLTPLQ